MSQNQASPETDKSLLRQLRDHTNKEAWQQFVDLYSPLVFSFCRRARLEEADAGDVTQNVFLQVMKSIRSFEYDPAKGTFRGWLGIITHRELLRSQRKSGGATDLANAENVEGTVLAEWTDAFNAHVLSQAMTRIRSEFDESSWQAFELTWKEHKLPVDVAKQLGRPVAWVYKARFRILQKLRNEVRMLAEDCSFMGGD